MTTNTERLERRKKRMAESPPILRGGFRIFFLASALWAILALAGWLTFLFTSVFAGLVVDPLAWHRHEMLFGFVGAAIAGFSLTAVPNWTGRLPIAGGPLAGLFFLWLAGRITPLVCSDLGMWTAIIDGGFYLVLAAFLGREILQSKNRNLPIVAIISLFGLAALFDRLEISGHIEWQGLAWRCGFALVILLITIVGGRIIPSFTRNWLVGQGVKHSLPTQPGRFDKATVLLGLLALGTWIAVPDTTVTSILLLIAGFGHLVRLARWRGWRCGRDVLVLILHIGYAWVGAGLVLLGLSQSGAIPQTTGVHALSAGAMATMILAVMARASLGHTARVLTAGRVLTASFFLITLAAIVRVMASLNVGDQQSSIMLAGMGWFGAFSLFLVKFVPILCSPRADELPRARRS